MITNNTGEVEGFGHALGWASSLAMEEGVMFVVDSTYGIQAYQALQRCSTNIRLVHAIRRIWRRMTATTAYSCNSWQGP